MSTLRIEGYTTGFLKISHTHYVRTAFGLGLRDGKAVTDDVLGGVAREFTVPTEDALRHQRALQALGARVVVVAA